MKKQTATFQPRNPNGSPEFSNTKISTEFSQIQTILSEIGQENVELESNEIYSPRKSLDLSSIKSKKLELEEKMINYASQLRQRPEKPKKIIKAKIANKKLENNK